MLDRLSLPVKIGIGAGLLGAVLVIIGIFRGTVPMNPASIAIALLIGAGFWFLVAWAVATAAVDVERDALPAARASIDEEGERAHGDG